MADASEQSTALLFDAGTTSVRAAAIDTGPRGPRWLGCAEVPRLSRFREPAAALRSALALLAQRIRRPQVAEPDARATRVLGIVCEDRDRPALEASLAREASCVPGCAALAAAVSRLAVLDSRRVVAAGVGSAHVCLIEAGPDDEKSIETCVGGVGVGAGAVEIARSAGVAALQRWMTADADETALRNAIGNRRLWPEALPCEPVDLDVGQALAREALRLALQAHRPSRAKSGSRVDDPWPRPSSARPPLLIASGAVFHQTSRRGQALLTLLDGLRPAGACEVWLDTDGALPMLGLLAGPRTDLFDAVVRQDALLPLGTSVAPLAGGPRPDSYRGARLRVMDVQFRARGECFTLRLAAGQLRLLPLEVDRTAELTLLPAEEVDAGAGPGQVHSLSVAGGAIGLVLDTRGPLDEGSLPPLGGPHRHGRSTDPRRALLLSWAHELDTGAP